MADNIAPDEVKRRLIMFLRIPNETWTDVLAMLSRRILIQQIAPTCYRLKEICDKNVKSVHVIRNAEKLVHNLENDKPEAKQQLEHLAALARQFRLTGSIEINQKNWDAIFRHCLELLRGCRIAFKCVYHRPQQFSFRQAFMTRMEQLEPVLIELKLLEPAKNSLLEHPTVWKCNRLSLDVPQTRANNRLGPTKFAGIHKWLHRRHDQEEGGEKQIRCMLLFVVGSQDHRSISSLLDQCIQDFKQSAKPTDRRKFVLNIRYEKFTLGYWMALANKFGHIENRIENRRIENRSTGELLQLQLVDREFLLRRCLAEEVEGPEEFYEKLFKRGIWDPVANRFGRGWFNMDEWKATEVRID